MIDSFMETLEQRALFSVTATFIPGAKVLTVLGDSLANNIVVSRNAAGTILVNGGAVRVIGGAPTVSNTSEIIVFGQAGDDAITFDESNGALPAADMFGGAGNDTLTGGSGNDIISGEAGNDTIFGKGGNDLLFGGADNDALTGGAGNDQVFGEAGIDTMIWNPGDGSDVNEGGADFDTIQVNGGNGAESFTATPNGSRVRFDRVSPAPFTLDIGTSESLVVNMNGGDDTFVGSNGLAPLINLTVNGGDGNDSITGGDGSDLLIGGDGNDLVIGGRGNDTALLGAGDDTFVWNPGDASDVIEGQDGVDTLQFNGANVAENMNISANGSRVRFTRDVGNVLMDLNGLETLNVTALGGADNFTVGDLTGTNTKSVNLDLGSPAGSGTGDAAADSVIVNGTNNADNVQVIGSGSSYTVLGLSATVNVSGSEGANDSLNVNLLNGNDNFSAVTLPAGVTRLNVDGGTGNDVITGSQGDDSLTGGDGADIITGGRGNDTAFMGNDNDTFVWNPGDGSDVVEGQAGFDTMLFNGSDAPEKFDLSANGTRLRLFRDVGNITMDTNGLELVNLNTLGGADTVTVNDLTGTGLGTLNLSLAATGGGGDGSVDTVVVSGSNSQDNILVASNTLGGIKIGGLKYAVNIASPEAQDQLTVNTLIGDDTVNASGLTAGAITLTENGGDGNDMLIGSAGNDLVIGGRGNDTALMGDGDDTFIWNPGDGNDTLEGQGGTDTMLFNGANVNENINLSANGSRLRFTRDVANITMDVNGVETVNFNAFGGVDTITVNDLTGTDVTAVNLDLAATPGSGVGDGAVDSVIVNGTNSEDTVVLAGDSTGVSVLGLFSKVNITGAESTDNLTVNLLNGDDVADASGVSGGAIHVTENGGDGNDVLVGGSGNDNLNGNNGDDVLIGNGGNDILDGGTGDNILIQ